MTQKHTKCNRPTNNYVLIYIHGFHLNYSVRDNGYMLIQSDILSRLYEFYAKLIFTSTHMVIGAASRRYLKYSPYCTA